MDSQCRCSRPATAFRCHGCSGPERAYRYFQVFSVKNNEDAEYTRDLCDTCFLQTEEGKAQWFHEALKAYQQQRRTRGSMEISRGVHAITFAVVSTFPARKDKSG